MTEEELKANIDAGRKWLLDHGFKTKKPIDGYFQEAQWQNDLKNVEIWEPSKEYARELVESGADIGFCDIWTCFVDYDEPDSYTHTYGTTPKEALERSLAEYDIEMATCRRQRFGAILNEEKALPEVVSASLSEIWERPLNSPPVERLKGEKIVLVDGHVVSKRDVDVYCREE